MSWVFATGQGSGWDHLGVLLSLVYRVLRCLLSLLAVLARSDLSKDAELLVPRHENLVLRAYLTHYNRHRPHQSRQQQPPGH